MEIGITHLFKRSSTTPDLLLEHPARIALLSILCVVESDVRSLCGHLHEIAAQWHDPTICIGKVEVEKQLQILVENGYVTEGEQRFGDIPLLLDLLLQQMHVHVSRGSYNVYGVTKRGREAFRAVCRARRDVQLEWKWS